MLMTNRFPEDKALSKWGLHLTERIYFYGILTVKVTEMKKLNLHTVEIL